MARIAPSILSADFLNLEEAVHEMEEAGAKILHVDVMDGHFVPNLTIGIPVIEQLRKKTELLLDVHLMISNPEESAGDYIRAGADYLSVHYEAARHLDRLLESIREQGAEPGVVLNPHTPVQLLEEVLHRCHHVLLMSVNPGFGGQEFIASSVEKVGKLRRLVASEGLDVKIEMDGGLGPANTGMVVEGGVDLVVAGSAIFHSGDPKQTFREMQSIADRAEELRGGDAISA